MAGNLLTWQEEGGQAFEVADGILPGFTVRLSGGSGTGVGSEGPSNLTMESMNIDIESDEDITGSPRVVSRLFEHRIPRRRRHEEAWRLRGQPHRLQRGQP